MKTKIFLSLTALVFITTTVWFCNQKPIDTVRNYFQIDTIYQDTGTHEVSYKPFPVYIDTSGIAIILDTTKIDSLAIIKDYISRVYYGDTIVNDSGIYISYKAVLQFNRLDSIKFDWANKRVTTISYPEYNTREFFIYGDAEVSRNLNCLNFGAALKRNNLLYIATYDILNKGVKIGIGIKILNNKKQ